MWEGNAVTFQELMDCWDRGEYNCNRAVYDKILEYAAGSNLVPVEVMAKACGDAWFDILRDSFDPQQLAQRRGSRPAYQKWLPQLFKGLVLTTNFDRCLEDLYGDPASGGASRSTSSSPRTPSRNESSICRTRRPSCWHCWIEKS